MTNFKLTIQYDGTRFSGWQKQGNTDNTIQGKIENILSKMTGEEIEIHGSGRTDAGVHAIKQIANFKTNATLSKTDIRDYINQYLPLDIRILSVEKADKMAKKYDCAFVDNEMPYVRVPQGHPVIVDYFYHEEIRGTENTGKRNR